MHDGDYSPGLICKTYIFVQCSSIAIYLPNQTYINDSTYTNDNICILNLKFVGMF